MLLLQWMTRWTCRGTRVVLQTFTSGDSSSTFSQLRETTWMKMTRRSGAQRTSGHLLHRMHPLHPITISFHLSSCFIIPILTRQTRLRDSEIHLLARCAPCTRKQVQQFLPQLSPQSSGCDVGNTPESSASRCWLCCRAKDPHLTPITFHRSWTSLSISGEWDSVRRIGICC